jgi:hypothetical protein
MPHADPMSDATRKYATIKHPTIEALVGGHYRYKDRAQALARFTSITGNFVLSKEQPVTTKADPATILWIKGFDVTEAEATVGFTGHFAEMRITKREDGIFTLTASKIEKPLAVHPQKKRPSAKHPNWGHPVMRAVKRRKTYATIEDAQAELELLHLEFPEVTIPGGAKLYIIIYEKRPGVTRPTHKIALEIETNPEGGFLITSRDNEKTAVPRSKAPASLPRAEKPAEKPAGHFANTVLLNRKKRRKNSGRPVTGMKPSDA